MVKSKVVKDLEQYKLIIKKFMEKYSEEWRKLGED
jgi:hypothetical protein